MSVHICGACKSEFPTEGDYNEHVCEKTGYKPSQIEHQDAMTGGQASRAREAALQRGAARAG